MRRKAQNTYKPNYAVPPGDTLCETIEAYDISLAELAERTGTTTKSINAIITAKAAITADAALQFARVLGVPASFWDNLERNYQETCSRMRADNQSVPTNRKTSLPLKRVNF